MTAKIIPFPLDRRMAQVTEQNGGMGVAHSVTIPGSHGTTSVSFATGGGGITSFVVGSPTSGEDPSWWSRIPPLSAERSDRNLWMKIGLNPQVRSKRHRVLAIEFSRVGGETVAMAMAACGRSAPLSNLFDDPWSSGDCQKCRERGWR